MNTLQLDVQDLEVRSFSTEPAAAYPVEPVTDPQYPGDTALCGPSRMGTCDPLTA